MLLLLLRYFYVSTKIARRIFRFFAVMWLVVCHAAALKSHGIGSNTGNTVHKKVL